MLTESSHKKIFIHILIITFFIAIIFSLLLYRATLSVEITDEVYGISSILGIVQGQRPLYTSWFHTGWCLIAPIYNLFIALNKGSTEEIVLFSRISYLILTMIVTSFIAIRLAKANKNICYLALSCCITYVFASVFLLGYNQLTVLILLLVAYCLEILWHKREQSYLWLIPGISMGLACINYPTLSAMTVIMAIVIVFFSEALGLKKSLWFSLGVIIVGGIFALWILSETSLEQILTAVDGMLQSPHEKLKGNFLLFTIKAFLNPIKSPKILATVLFFLLSSFFAHKRAINNKLNIHFIIYIIFTILNCSLLIYMPVSESINDLFAFIFWIITISWLLLDKLISSKKYMSYLVIQFCFALTYALTSANITFFRGFAVSSIMTSFLAIRVLIESSKGKNQLLTTLLALLVIATPGLLHVYKFVYRDEPVIQLNTKVERGIYKGLYTTSDRRDFVLQMEDIMSNYTTSNDSLCVVTVEPMLYIMSKAKITTPHTWDPQFLGYGFTSAEPILSYFKKLNLEYPSVLVATNTEIKDFFENDKYEIKKFIKGNYNILLFKEILGAKIALWRKKE